MTNGTPLQQSRKTLYRRIVILFFALYKYTYLLTYIVTKCAHMTDVQLVTDGIG